MAPGFSAAAPVTDSSRRAIGLWLLLCCVFVFATLVVGGATRLTHSGLSIVEWEPLLGVVPPRTESDWNELFGQYQQTPEYRKVNHAMGVDEFKRIFWWEYAHRVLARSIGVVFLLPFLWFLLRRRLDAAAVPRLAGLFILGGLQGAMGWYMVKSGLIDDPRVSHYRLAAHLGLAFVIFAAMFWVALGELAPRRQRHGKAGAGLRRAGVALAILVFVMVLSGALVAGIHAGKAFNTFPLMNGHWVPPEILALDPWPLNFVNNIATVQFDHRLIAGLLALLLPWFWWRARAAMPDRRGRLACDAMLTALAIQLSLGIATLLLYVPVALGAAHQGGAMLLFGSLLWVNHELRQTPTVRPPA